MARLDKLIVTNRSALTAKYGTANARSILDAVAELVAADAERDLRTVLVALDDAAATRRHKARAVTDWKSPRENKRAIDGLCDALGPDYVMILGAVDVVPHQDLRNPLYTDHPEGDTDRYAWSDLPYACEAEYSREIAQFRSPTRIVGRLPDVTCARDPRYLIGLLRTAASYRSRERSEFETPFGLTALSWKASTSLSLSNLFGPVPQALTSPPRGPRFGAPQLRRRTHFINCHGADADTFFYGEHPVTEDMPIAHSARYIAAASRLSEGTVVAAECCYGAQLHDPKQTKGQLGICNTYLQRRAYGFFGSSTTSYGPAEGNGQADLICQYFLERVLRGASLGRAVLEARQRFVQAAGLLNPEDAKTLAQFNLMGDPAIQPVQRAAHALHMSRTYRHGLTTPKAAQAARTQRREWLVRYGWGIGEVTATTHREREERAPAVVRTTLESAAREAGARKVKITSHRVTDPSARKIRSALGTSSTATEVHVAVGSTGKKRRVAGMRVHPLVAVIATVTGQQVTSLRRIHSR